MKRITWIVTLPAALLVILFVLMNRQEVVLSLWPLPGETPPLILSVLLFATAVIGFLVGALAAWLSAGATRQKLRAANRALAETRDEIAMLRRQQTQPGSQTGRIERRPPPALPPAA
ncbi:MAG: LapA family protein [Rhodospirillaceae bacterium]|nr:LapA family protein [Rhodospirillaceae bacterium]